MEVETANVLRPILPPGFSVQDVISNIDDNYLDINCNLPHLLILRGPVGSGKKTLADRQVLYHKFVTFSTNDYLEKEEHVAGDKALEEARYNCLVDVISNLQQGRNVVLHDTLITLQELLPYLMLRRIAQVTVWKLGTQFCPDIEVDALTVKKQRDSYESYYLEDEVRLFIATGIICKMVKNKFTGKKDLIPINL